MHVVYRGIFKLLALATLIAATTSLAFYVAVSADNASLIWIAAAGFAVIAFAKSAHLVRLVASSMKRSGDRNGSQ
jgi:hypothetical protein